MARVKLKWSIVNYSVFRKVKVTQPTFSTWVNSPHIATSLGSPFPLPIPNCRTNKLSIFGGIEIIFWKPFLRFAGMIYQVTFVFIGKSHAWFFSLDILKSIWRFQLPLSLIFLPTFHLINSFLNEFYTVFPTKRQKTNLFSDKNKCNPSLLEPNHLNTNKFDFNIYISYQMSFTLKICNIFESLPFHFRTQLSGPMGTAHDQFQTSSNDIRRLLVHSTRSCKYFNRYSFWLKKK